MARIPFVVGTPARCRVLKTPRWLGADAAFGAALPPAAWFGNRAVQQWALSVPRRLCSTSPAKQTVLDRVETAPISGSRIIRNATVQDNYTKEGIVLGVGVSGEVHRVRHNTSGKHFALKSLQLGSFSQKRLTMLLDEVEIYLMIDHPNICKLVEVYQDDKAVHLVMELCEGRDLSHRLEKQKRYSEHGAAVVCTQMLEVLSYLHWQGICHRDMKLENWVYEDDSKYAKLKLIDFGLSKRFSDMDGSEMEGTVAYMAPEIWEGDFDEKCDIWALGVIVYVLLNGSLPFADQNSSDVVRRIMMEGFPLVGPRWDELSDLAKDFVSSLLEEDPEARPNVKTCLYHPWLVAMSCGPGSHSGAAEISEDVLRTLLAFVEQNALKRAACQMMAFSMSARDLSEMELQFHALDRDGTGIISFEDLAYVLKRYMRVSSTDAHRIFEALDQTGNHAIHYTEFLAAAVVSRSILHKGAIREAFDKFDVDGKGYISVDDLRRVLGDEYAGKQVEDIIAEIDSSKDGRIEYYEFVQALEERPPGSDVPIGSEVIRKASRRTLGRISRKQAHPVKTAR